MNITYPSDLTDTEWKCLQQYLLQSRSGRGHDLPNTLEICALYADEVSRLLLGPTSLTEEYLVLTLRNR